MRKYSAVHNMVFRLTEDPTLRTFFTLYLMAASVQERQAISQQFWQEAKTLSEVEYTELQAAFTQSFKQLLPLANQLHKKVIAATQRTNAHA